MTTLKRVRGFTDSEPDKEPNNGSSNGLVNNYRKRVDLTKLNLSDDKLFSLLMGYDDFCKTVLEIVLGIELESIERVEVQQTYQNVIEYKSIRLDVFAKGVDGTIYNVEMQQLKNDDMPLRARFYQGLMDASTLFNGRKYRELPKSYVIFITEFDVFDRGLYRYTFKNKCDEVPDLELGDNTVKMFLNTKGTIQNDEPDELIHFLKFVHDSSISVDDSDRSLKKLQTIYKSLLTERDLEDNYMRMDWVKEEGRKEGSEEGREEGREEGKEAILIKMISSKRKLHISEDAILEELVSVYDLTITDAKNLMSSVK